jgi:lipopolysaccharide transport system permease protein
MNRFFDDLREVWRYRGFLRMLVERDLKTRYRNSVLGVAWSFLQPLGMMLVFSVMATLINVSPRPNNHVFVLSGLLAWNFFSASVVGGTGSIVANSALVKKVYFPRLILPISVVISSLVNYLLALPVYLVVALASGQPLHETMVLLPVIILIQVVFSVGISFMLATLNVFYRDTQFILDLAMLALFFLTPIWYSLDDTQAATYAVWLRRLNPMASIVNIYQDLMYWGRVTIGAFWFRTSLTAIVVLILGYFIFTRFSPRFGEEV